jgi:hypothetical protein
MGYSKLTVLPMTPDVPRGIFAMVAPNAALLAIGTAR